MNVAVIIPIYKKNLELFERVSLSQCRYILKKYPIIFIAPEGKHFKYINNKEKIIYFDKKFFQSVKTYNQLMLSPIFYKTFIDQGFDYILIYQLDAYVFYDALEDFCNLLYDYIGAPWPFLFCYNKSNGSYLRVGNGGFSLRNTKACYNVCENFLSYILKLCNDINEDVVFSIAGTMKECNFKVAPINIAYSFSMEFHPFRVIRKNNDKFPFGSHGIIPVNSNESLLKGTPNILYKSDENSKRVLTYWLMEIAYQRLIRRIINKRSISKYLSIKTFDAIHVVNTDNNILILNQLKSEININKVYIYEKDDFINCINDMNKNGIHLILDYDYNNLILKQLNQLNYIEGKNYILFWKEYYIYCKNLLFNLGK